MSIPAEHEQAIARFESYAAHDPRNAHLLVTLGDLYHRAGRFDEALATYRRVIDAEPAHQVARSRLAGVQISQHAFGQAEQTLRALLDDGHDNPALTHNLGLSLFYQERFDEALDAFEQAGAAGSELPPRNLAYQAYALHHLGRTEEALERARAWVERESTTEAHGYLSLVEMDRGLMDDARGRATQVLEHDPDNADAGVVVGTSCLEQQEMERAADLFRRIIGRDQANPRAWLGLGLVHLYAQRFDDAIDALHRTLALVPRNGGARVTLGWTHLLAHDLDKAERVFAEAVEVNRNFAEAHGGYASILALRGRRDEAQSYIRRARGLSREGFGAVFAQSVLLEQEGKRDVATRLVERTLARELRPGAPRLIDAVQTYARHEAAKGVGRDPEAP